MQEHGTNEAIQLRPVGVVRNNSKEPSWGEALGALGWQERASRMKAQRESVSEVVVDPALEGILDGIEGYSHITVIYWAHLVPGDKRPVKVHPMNNPDFPLVGVFATHSPVRPNSILLTVARLLERGGNTLKVTGLDALDGSPVLDIKPYNPSRDPEHARIPEWMKRLQDENAQMQDDCTT